MLQSMGPKKSDMTERLNRLMTMCGCASEFDIKEHLFLLSQGCYQSGL